MQPASSSWHQGPIAILLRFSDLVRCTHAQSSLLFMLVKKGFSYGKDASVTVSVAISEFTEMRKLLVRDPTEE